MKKKISLALLLIPFIFLISLFFKGLASPGLTCQLRQTSCQGNEICVFSMFNYTNSHAGDCNYGDWKVCCRDPAVILTSYIQPSNCSEGDGGVLRLYQQSNSHVEEYTETNFNYRVCLSSSSGSIFCSYKNSCGVDEAQLGSLNKSTNSHVSDNDYPIKICCGYSIPPCDLDITSAEPPPMTVRGDLANATVNVTNNGGEACWGYVECEYEDPNNVKYLVTQSCPSINPGETYTSRPGMIVDEEGTWNVTYCSVNASFDSTCGTLVPHDIWWNVGTFEDVQCMEDDDCEPYQKCDCPLPACSRQVYINYTCYDFRPECIACNYYDYCREGMDPDNSAQSCCNDTVGFRECCLQSGIPVLNCSLPGAIRDPSVTAHPDFCYVEGYDITDLCIDWTISPHEIIVC